MNKKMRASAIFVAGLLALCICSLSEAKGTKKSYAEAKKECLQEDGQLRGKKLQTCIKKKRS